MTDYTCGPKFWRDEIYAYKDYIYKFYFTDQIYNKFHFYFLI